MEQNITLSIDSPCTEKFETFRPSKNGGFCTSCQKEVIDFTKMTDGEILQYFKNHQEKKTCGRFQDFQLKNVYSETLPSKSKNSFRILGLGLMSFSLFSPFLANKAQAQENQQIIALNIPKSEKSHKQNTNLDNKNEKIVLEGKVTDENGEGLPGINASVKGTVLGTITGSDGSFKFSIPATINAFNLVFSAIGYKSKSIEVSKNNLKKINIILEEEHLCLMGEVNVNQVYQSKPSFWQKVKGIFK